MRASFAVLVCLVMAFAVVIRWDALDAGLFFDDFAQDAMLDGRYPGAPASPWAAYAFYPDDPSQRRELAAQGALPWWAADEVRLTAWRPLSSALLALDRVVAPTRSEGASERWHLHSLVWLGASILAAALALRALLPTTSLTLLALWLLASDFSLAASASWLANRCSLVSVTFSWLALWAHARWRGGPDGGEDSAAPGSSMRAAGLEAALIALALAAGEYGVAAIGYILAFELIMGRGHEHRTRGLRLVSLAPALVVSAAYLTLRWLVPLGTASPWTAPPSIGGGAAILWTLPVPLADFLLGGLWGLPNYSLLTHAADAIPFQNDVSWVSSWTSGGALALVAIALVAYGWPRLEGDERRGVWTLIVGAWISFLPFCWVAAAYRLHVLGALGFSALVAAVVVGSARRLASTIHSGRDALVRSPVVAALLLLVFSNGIAEVAWTRVTIDDSRRGAEGIVRLVEGGDLLASSLADRDVIVLSTLDPTVATYGAFVLHARGHEVPLSFRTLAMFRRPGIATRTDVDALEVRTLNEHWFSSGSRAYRPRRYPLASGSVVDWPGLRAEVLADHEGSPTTVRFQFPSSLDDPRYVFAVVRDGALERWTPPAIGDRIGVPGG